MSTRIDCHTFSIFEPYSDQFLAGVTRRSMGSFKPGQPEFIERYAALELPEPAFANQIHSDFIIETSKPFYKSPEADGLMTKSKNLPLLTYIADCQGVIIFDPQEKAIAVVHSGWRGSAQNIIGKAIQKMVTHFSSKTSDLLVAISPSLGPCCAQFSDPFSELPPFCHPFIQDNRHVDFWSISQKQCEEMGILKSNIERSDICSRCDEHSFSHRRGDSGRMAVFAQLC